MSLRASVAVIVDLTLGSLLLLLRIKRIHLTVETKTGSAIVPTIWLDLAMLLIIAAVTAWWFFGRKDI